MAITDKPLLPDFVMKQGLVNPCLARGSDFEIYTGSMHTDQNSDPDKPVITMVGSSTVRDLQGDVMALSALDDMTKIPDNLTVWLNHNYDLPGSLLGSLVGRPWIQSQNNIADLHLTAEIETSNPNAMQTYNMINRGRRLGCSIGCQVLDYDYDESTQTIIILSVYTVEFSCVGIPASQRCWVEVATKSLFERSLIEGQADKALQLAPAVRGMYWRSYDALVKHVELTSLRNDLERVRPRETAAHRIMHVFNDGEMQFALADTKGIKKSLSREEVAGLLKEHILQQYNEAVPQEEEANPVQTEVVELEDIDTKSVSGNTSFDLMSIDTEWDGSKAESQIFAWAKNGDGEITTKAKQCFLYCDPDNADKQSGYKLPYCYIVSGTPKIVPLGVRAIAGVLSGGRGGVDAGDQSGMKAKVKTLYGRINSQFKPDPAWSVPWENDDKGKSADDGDTITKDVLDTESGTALNRQDLAENEEDKTKSMPQASDVEVSSDGSHAACTGTHTHSHKTYGSQGSDEQHSHAHSHDGDSNHDHHNDDSSKASEPEVTKTQEEPSLPDIVLPEIDYQKGLLFAYNRLGKELGFDPVSLEKKQKSLMSVSDGVSLQDIVTHLSAADSNIDWLMDALGVPDLDEDDGTSPVSPSMGWAIDTSTLATKSGKEISAKNMQHVQKIMNCSLALGASCPACGATGAQTENVDEATNEARTQGEGQPLQQYPSMSASIEAISNLTKSLEAMNMKSIVQEAVRTELDVALEEAHKSLDLLQREQRVLLESTRKLKDMPLGRPTQFAGRTTTVEEEGIASYQDMLTAGASMLDVPVSELETVYIETARGRIKCKRWPAGYKAGQRPQLQEYQKVYMNPLTFRAYEQASSDVIVPDVSEMIAGS